MNRLINGLTGASQVILGCTGSIFSGSIRINDACIIQQQLPAFSTEQIVDLARPYIKGFEQKYEPYSNEQLRSGTKVIRNDQIKNDQIDPQILNHYKISGIDGIFLPITKVLPALSEQLSRAPAHRTITNYGSCAKQNYLVAAKHFGKVILKPGEQFEINQHISHLKGYCRGDGEEYMFYQGVCGLSTQLFRAGLIHPDIEIIRRAPHSKRYTRYYGETVYGDDSAIYENLKKLVIKNRGNENLYIRSLSGATEHYVVIVSHKKSEDILIQKSESDKLTGRLGRKIYNEKGELIEKQIWQSTYGSKYRESN